MTRVDARAGRYVRQPAGFRAFVPAPLPPDPPVSLDGPLVALLSRADQALGRLDSVAETLPNPDLVVAMYVRREAVESSQIEGTRSTLVLAGRDDWITPPAESERLRAGIPNADLVVFEESGHVPFIEEQAAFLRAVETWLAELPQPSYPSA